MAQEAAPERSSQVNPGKAAGTMVHHSAVPADLEHPIRSLLKRHRPVAVAWVRDPQYRLPRRHKACCMPTERHIRTPAKGTQRKRQDGGRHVCRLDCRRSDEKEHRPASVSGDHLVQAVCALSAHTLWRDLGWESALYGPTPRNVPGRLAQEHVEQTALPRPQR
jgi:hypothetical protein